VLGRSRARWFTARNAGDDQRPFPFRNKKKGIEKRFVFWWNTFSKRVIIGEKIQGDTEISSGGTIRQSKTKMWSGVICGEEGGWISDPVARRMLGPPAERT